MPNGPGEPGLPAAPVQPGGPGRPPGPCSPGGPCIPLRPGGPVEPTAHVHRIHTVEWNLMFFDILRVARGLAINRSWVQILLGTKAG